MLPRNSTRTPRCSSCLYLGLTQSFNVRFPGPLGWERVLVNSRTPVNLQEAQLPNLLSPLSLQLFEVLYLGRVRLQGKSVDNFDSIISGVYAKLHAVGQGPRIRVDSASSVASCDLSDGHPETHSADSSDDGPFGPARRRRTSSSCSVGPGAMDANRSALLDISAGSIRLFNLEHRCVLWENSVRNVSSILSSYRLPDHLGLIAEADLDEQPCVNDHFRYTLYIVQCANKDIATSAFAVLKQTFLNCQSASRLCDQCPVHQFNKLCESLARSSPEAVNSALTDHVLAMNARDTDSVEQWMRSCDAETLERKNEMFVAFLRRMADTKQTQHLHERPASASAAEDELKKADILTRAKNTFFSSFKSLKRAGTPELPTDTRARPRASTVLGLERNTSLDENCRFDFNSQPASYEASPNLYSPPVCREATNFDFGPSPPPVSRLRSATLDAKTTATLFREESARHRSGEERPNTPTERPSRRRSNSGGISDLPSDLSLGHHQQRRQSMRFKIFNSVVSAPHQHNVHVITEDEDEDEDFAFSSASPLRLARLRKVQRSQDRYRALWRKAISEIRLLIRMEKENAVSWGPKGDLSESLLCSDYAYEDIANPPSAAVARQWKELLDAEERADLSLANLHVAIRSGVPRGRRADAWRLVMRHWRRQRHLNADGAGKENSEESYQELTRKLTSHQHAIIIDVGRTYPSHPLFADPERGGQLCLFNILKAYSLLDPEVGYCQGLSFIVGMLLIHMTERDSFEALKFLMFDLQFRTIFTPDMSHMQLCLYQLSRLIHDHLPDLHQHFEEHSISPSFYATPWFLSLFATQYSLGFVARAFDLLFCFGAEAIFRIGFVLLQENLNDLLACKNFESICDALRSVLPTMSRVHVQKVFDQAFRVDFTDDLRTYSIEYRVLNEEVISNERSNHDYSRRLQDLNRELAKQKREISARFEASERVTRAQAERLAALQRDLEKSLTAKRKLQRECEELRELVARLREAFLQSCPEPGEALGEKLALEIAAALS